MIDKVKSVFTPKLEAKDRAKVDFLKSLVLFSDFSDQECLPFLSFIYERSYKKNEVVFFRDDASQALYLLKKGRVELSLDIGDKDEHLYTCEGPSVFGLNSLIKDRRRDFNAVVTSEKASIYVIPHSDIFSIMDSEPVIKGKLLYNLAKTYDFMFERLFDIYRSNIGFFELRKVF